MKISVMIVDDHPVVRKGLIDVLTLQPELSIWGEAGSLMEASKLLDAAPDIPTVVILDINLRDGNGLEWIKNSKVMERLPTVLVMSVNDESIYAERCIRAGAKGYVMKDAPVENILEAIQTVASGKIWASAEIRERLLNNYSHDAERRRAIETRSVSALSDRELEIFQLLGSGKSIKEAAEILKISPKTAETHRSHIADKLGLAGSHDLVRMATVWVEGTQI